MENLRKQVAELEAKASEAALIADLATDPLARVKYARLAHHLAAAIEGLHLAHPDRAFLLRQAEKCRNIATSTTDRSMHAELLALAAQFEDKANQF